MNIGIFPMDMEYLGYYAPRILIMSLQAQGHHIEFYQYNEQYDIVYVLTKPGISDDTWKRLLNADEIIQFDCTQTKKL